MINVIMETCSIMLQDASVHRIAIEILKIEAPYKNSCHHCPKNETAWFDYVVMHPRDADGMVNNVDLDQTAPLGAV